jgi:heat-inducible transcriptional repressor
MTSVPPLAAELNERQRLILAAIVEDYISTAEPVGSRTITKRSDVTVSAATIRNVMSDLEEMGLLVQPHTSAGRVPTDKAFRFYVDTLVRMRRPSFREQEHLATTVRQAGSLEGVMEAATRHLSALSHHTGVLLQPRRTDTRLHHIEFVRLPDGKVLVIVVDQGGMVQNRILEPQQGVNVEQARLNEVAVQLNERFRGLTLGEVRDRLVTEMREARQQVNAIMMEAMALADRVLIDAERGPKDVILMGEARLLESPEFAPVDKMKTLLKAFEERSAFVHLLDRIELAADVKVFIGQETRFREMAECSVVAASYGTPERMLGCIGVIGPTRMDYARVVPLVELTAQMISEAMQRGAPPLRG